MAEDGTVLLFTTFSVTHTGRFKWLGCGPWEPTGRPMARWETFAAGITDARITRLRGLWDPENLAHQLGVSR